MRIATPALTLGIAIANNAFQLAVAERNAPLIVTACNEYRATNGGFPMTLDELVPRYIASVPRAKHCVGPWGQFDYYFHEGKPLLVWYVVPPFYRRIYDFDTRALEEHRIVRHGLKYIGPLCVGRADVDNRNGRGRNAPEQREKLRSRN